MTDKPRLQLPPSGFIDKGTLDGVYEFKKVKNRMLFSNTNNLKK